MAEISHRLREAPAECHEDQHTHHAARHAQLHRPHEGAGLEDLFHHDHADGHQEHRSDAVGHAHPEVVHINLLPVRLPTDQQQAGHHQRETAQLHGAQRFGKEQHREQDDEGAEQAGDDSRATGAHHVQGLEVPGIGDRDAQVARQNHDGVFGRGEFRRRESLGQEQRRPQQDEPQYDLEEIGFKRWQRGAGPSKQHDRQRPDERRGEREEFTRTHHAAGLP